MSPTAPTIGMRNSDASVAEMNTCILITVADELNKLPIEGAEIVVQPCDIHATTDVDGIAEIPVEEGTYNIRITAEGYTAHNEYGVKVNTASNALNIIMIRTP